MEESDDIGMDPEKVERLKELFSARSLWEGLKENKTMILIWITWFLLGFYLASQYYSVSASNFVYEECLKHGKVVIDPTIDWVKGTVFG